MLSFAALIASGTVLLWLPVSAAREPLTVVDALFTATSAVCVTGLIVVDTPNDLTLFGQVVVLLLIQLGGLGYMAITTVVGVALGRQLTVHERLTLQEALNVQTMEGLARFVLTVLKLTLLFELCGALLLTARWTSEHGLARAAYYGVFHAISAFNNAGFALFPDSLIRFRGDWLVNLVVTSLIICGGLGFVVLTEIGRVRQFRRFSTHTRLVVTLTAALIVSTTVLFWLIERDNPRTLGPMGPGEAVMAAYFQVDYIELSRDFSIVEVPAPHAFVGRTLKQLELRPRLGLTLIAIKRQSDDSAAVVTNIAPAADETIRQGDILALLGSNERLNQLDQLLSR